MTDLVYDYIATGVDMIISAVILSAIVVLLRGTSTLTSFSANQQAIVEGISYYKEFNIYDNTKNLSSADVISTFSRYRSEVEISLSMGRELYDVDGDGAKDGIIRISNKSGTTLFANDKYVVFFYKSNNAATGEKSTSITFEQLRKMLPADFTYSAKICEDGAEAPSEYYGGGVISGIKIVKD